MSRVTESAEEFTVLASPYRLHGLHGLALIACWFNGLTVAYRCLLMMLVAASWLKNWLLAARSLPSHLRYTASQCWYISYDGLEYFPITIEPVSVVNSMVLVLHYRLGIAGTVKFRSLFITRHSMPVTHFRRLLVRLKLSRIDRDK